MLLLLLSLVAFPLVRATGINFLDLPADLTTPYQQRLAINGPNGMYAPCFSVMIVT